jgi:SPP1 family phage portal protein
MAIQGNVVSTGFYGRKVLTTEYSEITADNIVTVLHDVLPTFEANVAQINYLYDYYKGKQAILNKSKKVRPEINFKITENRANEIVSFKKGYLVGEPIQYVLRETDENLVDGVHTLNNFMLFEDKAYKDTQLAKWLYVCGTSYRMVLPNPKPVLGEDDSPFNIYTLKPTSAFVIYSDDIEDKPLVGVKVSIDPADGTKTRKMYHCYTATDYFLVVDDTIIRHEKHILGGIPIIEYPANDERLGAFEIVLPLLDAINITSSGRIDGLQQFVESLLKLVNTDISDEQFDELREKGCIKIKDTNGTATVEYLDHELNQTQLQVLVEWEYNVVLTIVGMPNRNGGSSTSDTGAAVIMRDGWSDAEARAKEDEAIFKKSESNFLKLVLGYCRALGCLSLATCCVDIRFTRRNYENIEQKSTVLCTLLASGKVHPKLAFEICGAFTDPTLAYEMSEQYIKEQQALAEAQAQAQTNADDGGGAGDGTA